MPISPINLLSATALELRDIQYCQKSQTLINRTSREQLIRLINKHNVKCLLNLIPLRNNDYATAFKVLACASLLLGAKPSLQLMHKRLYYLGKERLLHACKEASLRFNKAEIALFYYKSYSLSKLKEIVSCVKRVKHSKLGIFYADLITITPTATSIYKYAFYIIKQTIGYYQIQGLKLKKKAETIQALNDFFTIFKVQTSYKPRVLYINKRGEFLNYLFNVKLRIKGIILEVIALDTLAQNRPAERARAIIIKDTYCIIDSSRIPYTLQLYAIRIAITILNLLPALVNRGKSPYECLSTFIELRGSKPYIYYLQTFSCIAYIYKKGSLRPTKLAKMQP